MQTSGDERRRFTRRLLLLGAAQAGVGLVVAGRMAQLTVQESARYRLLAEDNRVAERLIAPRRGWIIDRRGRPLAMNRPEYRLQLVADEVPDLEATLAELEVLLSLPPEELARIRAEVAERPGYLPVAVKLDMPWEEFAAVNVRLPELPGVLPVRGFKRLYAGGSAYGQLLGYMGAPSAEEYKRTRNRLLMLPGFKVG
ncbi:MAG: penicillin-binding protein 2, partial [Sphingomonadaceae bacterium]